MANEKQTIVNNNQNGQDKCPKCGSTDITLDVKTGMLRCNFCRFEFSSLKNNAETNIENLQGQHIGEGASDINRSESSLITLKCSSCGAEVTIDTDSVAQARCHWCRNILSVNEQVPTGAIPDVILPFKITKDEAKGQIANFVNKRKFFANPTFRREFTTENIIGVYFPYMVVDLNSHANLSGQGEHLVNTFVERHNNVSQTYYDADLYNVERDFDLVIKGLTIESSLDKLNNQSLQKTNNVINSIMPFDIENCVSFNANYLRGFNSEKRDTNINLLRPLIIAQGQDIAKFSINGTLKKYDRGIRWDKIDFNILGEQWQAAYLPVWLYSYMDKNKMLHYVAVNGRTKEVMGSIPIHMPKLIIASCIVEFIGYILMINIDFEYNWLFLLLGFIYYFIMYSRYRNNNARHKYETETTKNVSNLKEMDNFVRRNSHVPNSMIYGANNQTVTGTALNDKVIKEISK